MLTDTQIQDLTDSVKKDILSSNIQGLAGDTGLSRQDLDSFLTKLTNRGTPVRDLLKRKKGNGLAHSFNLRQTLDSDNDPLDLLYAENSIPTVGTPAYTQVSVPYVRLGKTSVISNFAIAAGRSYADLEAEAVEVATRSVIQAEEWMIINGNNTIANSNGLYPFEGLASFTATNVISLAGALTSTDPLDHAIQMIRANGGGTGRMAVVCSFGIQRKINQLQQSSGDLRVIFDDPAKTVFGLHTPMYQSPVGEIPIIGDYFINPQGKNPYPYNSAGNSSSTSGNTSSTIYIVDLDQLAMVDLMGLAQVDLAMITDEKRVMVNEYTVFEVVAEPWIAAITGVTEPTY